MKKTPLIVLASLAVLLAACGREESAPPAAPAAAPAPSATPAPAPAPAPAPMAAAPASDAGQTIYNRSCALCHAAGVGGAPKPGDKEDWAARVEQGMDVVYKHAIEGFTGAKGMMPPRGGAGGLSDEEVMAAVDYMVGQSQ